ncbi:uncharacterized protein [Panulirus ornatus]|uniref:uncharacterized protein n=1 Tax=Panulirus ornatus TaxID=150431 RepID=UPI003A8AD421
MAPLAVLALLVVPLCVSSGSPRLQHGISARIYGQRRRCPRQTSCYPPTSYFNPCCLQLPPVDPTPPPTWVPPVDPTPPPTTPAPTNPPPTCPALTNPPTMPPTPPPTNPPTEPPIPIPPIPSTWCDIYGQCGCPVMPPACPFAAMAAGLRRRRRAQRKCYMNGHCPVGTSCCKDGCHGSKVCVASTPTPTPAAAHVHKVNVSVVMTSASRASHWFLTTHLYPFFRDLKDNLDVELIPYGKVTEGRCQFGLGDCLGNWMVSCAREHLPTQDAQLAFTSCLMTNTDLLQSYNFTSITYTAVKCAQSFPSKMKALYRCGVGLEGYRLFQEAGRRQYQLAPSVTEVPTVALDGVVVITRNEDIARFPGLVCARLRKVPQAQALCQRALNGR